LDHNTQVVDFYQQAPDGYPVADEGWDTWKQLATLQLAQTHWADQAVSVTVYYRKHEIPAIKAWLRDNLSKIKTISFLCHNDHGFVQAPKEAIGRELYEKLVSKVKPLETAEISEGELLQDIECAGGVCPVR
jgi:hypothetical protein